MVAGTFACDLLLLYPEVIHISNCPLSPICLPKFSCCCTYLGLLSLLEESLLSLLLGALAGSEVSGLRDLLQSLLVETGQLDRCAGGNDISGIDPSEWDTVELVRTSNEEDTLWEVLEEDDTLATETASEEDEDGAWLETGAWLSGVDGLANL